jgi:hypothetical protein
MCPAEVQGYSGTAVVLVWGMGYRSTGELKVENRLTGVIQWDWYSTGVHV